MGRTGALTSRCTGCNIEPNPSSSSSLSTSSSLQVSVGPLREPPLPARRHRAAGEQGRRLGDHTHRHRRRLVHFHERHLQPATLTAARPLPRAAVQPQLLRPEELHDRYQAVNQRYLTPTSPGSWACFSHRLLFCYFVYRVFKKSVHSSEKWTLILNTLYNVHVSVCLSRDPLPVQIGLDLGS